MIKKWDIPIWEKKDELIGSVIIEADGAEIVAVKFGKDGMKIYLISAIPEDTEVANLVVSEFDTGELDVALKKAIEILREGMA